jgi:zinc transporter 5/7
MSLEGVVSYRNLHFWQHYKDLMVGTIHVQIAPEAVQQKILAQVSKIFKKKGVKSLAVEISR